MDVFAKGLDPIPAGAAYASIVATVVGLWIASPFLVAQFRFFWHCFLVPIGRQADQSQRLNKFYEGQAEIYDKTRDGLLRGRKTMLSLSISHLKVMREKNPDARFVWVDIGGGTGWNIEQMATQIPLSTFSHIYLVDLCEPLLAVARQRFESKGWTNITVLCQDATSFSLPEWSQGVDPKGSVGFVSISYALSMIPNFYLLLDRINEILCPQTGLLSVVDFYASRSASQLSPHEKAIGGTKECSWFTRWFWQIWFDFDHVSLNPARRDYLEYKFGTVKSYNGRNKYVLPFIIRIPYYIWLGRSRNVDVSAFRHAFQVEGGNIITDGSPMLGRNTPPPSYEDIVPPLDIGQAILPTKEVMMKPTLSSFHYQLKFPWRLPYYDSPVHKEFRTFIYSFTWEDPAEDMKHLKLSSDDTMLVITSAGDNALHYAINAKPKQIHCVDMNPCQGHLLELKLAAMQSMEYDDFFALFGFGAYPTFRLLLDNKIAPLLSSHAYQFWRNNQTMFSSSFYRRGYAGWGLRLAKWIFTLAGVHEDAVAMCRATTIEEQQRIWSERLRPVLLNKLVVLLLKNPVFCWNALGVPLNQRKMFLNEGTAYEFVRDSLDPLASHALFSRGAYFYLLTLLGHYVPDSCPDYLTRDGFDKLKAEKGEAAKAFRLHTDSIVNVLRGLPSHSLTRVVLMDHLDWFNTDGKDVDEELTELYRVVAPGGLVMWRSAARQPWYNENFKQAGFKVRALGIRKGPQEAIDRVNMYASCWAGEK